MTVRGHDSDRNEISELQLQEEILWQKIREAERRRHAVSRPIQRRQVDFQRGVKERDLFSVLRDTALKRMKVLLFDHWAKQSASYSESKVY